MSNEQITFPTGRLVAGSIYRANTKDAEGRPLVFKSTNEPREDYYFAVAIPKGAEQHWASTEWGAKIWAVGHAFMAQAGQMPSFAWKITDGDSTVPNKKGHKPCDREGYPGHWVVNFSSSFPSQIWNADASQRIEVPDAIKPGYYIQVAARVKGNGAQSQPGVFINHEHVALQGYGQIINLGTDASNLGFGGGPLPAGATAVPTGAFTPPVTAMTPPPAPATGAPSTPPPPAVTAASAPSAPPAMPAPPVTAVAPNPGMLAAPPAAPAAPPAPPAAPAAPTGPTMTAKANGVTYEQFVASGWSEAALRAEGYIL